MDEDKSVAELLSMMRSLSNDFQSQAKLMLEMERKIDLILSAFPASGLAAHKADHEKRETAEHDAHAFRQSLRTGVAMFGIPVLLSFVGYAIWEYLKLKVHQ